MALTREQKQAIVAEVAEVARRAQSAIAAEYLGLTANEMNELRKEARQAKVYLKVVKNRLAKRALAGTEYECMNDHLRGPLLFAFSLEEPGAAARVIRDFRKGHEQLRPKLIAVGGQLFGEEALERLASLPTREEALAMLLRVMKAPIEQFVRTLAEPYAKLVRTLAALKEKRG